MAKETTIAADATIKVELEGYKVTSAAALKKCAVLHTEIAPVDVKLKGPTSSTTPPGAPGLKIPAPPSDKQLGDSGADAQVTKTGTKTNTESQQAAKSAAANAAKKDEKQKNTSQQTDKQSSKTTVKTVAKAATSAVAKKKKGGKL